MAKQLFYLNCYELTSREYDPIRIKVQLSDGDGEYDLILDTAEAEQLINDLKQSLGDMGVFLPPEN
jgi:hypothetical protein